MPIADARVLILGADDVEDMELLYPLYRLREENATVTLATLGGRPITGKKGHGPVAPDAATDDVRSADFDALVIPGGYSPDKLRVDDDVVAFVRGFFDQGKTVAAICHAPSLLVEADVLRGRTLTSWPSVRKDVENAGGKWVDREVVRDGNLITSRKPGDLDAFCAALLEGVARRASA